MSKKRKLLLLFLIVAVGLGFAAKYLFFHETFRYAGTLEATKVDLSARLASNIKDVKVHEGDHVREGQNLVTLSCEDVKLADDLASENYTRALRLYKAGSTSKEVFDKMQNAKQDADVKLGWCNISSPISGIVLDRYHEPGEWVSPGTKILTLANIRDIWAYIYVPQPEVSRLKTGMKLPGYLPELGDREFDGKIIKINAEAEFTPKNVQTQSERERLVFGVKISFLGSNDDETLKPGMTIEVVLPKEARP